MTDTTDLKRTPLHRAHVEAGGRMVPFGGWDMPVQYSDGIISEVRAVRNSAGMFDVSHMGRVEFSGPGAVPFLDTVLSADVAALREGRSKYHVICNAEGGIIDDAMVYRLAEDRCLLVVNAGNADAVMEWLTPRAREHGGVEIDIITDRVSMIAVQGPNAVETVDRLSSIDVTSVRRFRIGEAQVAGIPCRLARTGYTGEDGFEIMPPAERAAELWQRLADEGVQPCGLGARDVLRLEAGLLLHGNDMTVENNPFEAGLDRFVHLDSPGYVAADALRRIRDEGTPRVLVGFNMIGRGIPRHGLDIQEDGRVIGQVTSGTHSPTLDANIGMGYVERQYAEPSTRFEIDVRGRLVEAEVVPLPFYSPGRS